MAAEEIQELLRQHGKERILAVLEEAGYSPRNNRFRCCFQGCNDKPLADRARNAAVFAAGDVYRVKCHSCQGGGTLIDVLMAVRGWSLREAIEHLKGVATAPSKPRLHVVPTVRATDPEKLTPEQVSHIWEKLQKEDPFGLSSGYLEARGLLPAIEKGLVRFVSTRQAPNKTLEKMAVKGWTVAMLCRDVTGNALGIQLRLTREPKIREPKILSVTGSTMSGAFFGEPGLIEQADMVCVTEGMADTLAVSLWAREHIPTVGAPGMGNLDKLADELASNGINVEGKLFLLFPQNDRPTNKSRGRFKRLAQKLHAAGASTVFCSVPEDFEDIADWRRTHPDTEWPPDALRAHLDHNSEGDKPPVVTEGIGLPVPSQFESKSISKSISSLLALLDDPYSREAIMGKPGEFSFCQMRSAMLFDEAVLREVELTVIRAGIERFIESTSGRPVQFNPDDIRKSIEVLCHRNSIHPVRDWLNGLVWDKTERIGAELHEAITPRPEGLTAIIWRKWFVSTVARALEPGCKCDTVLVLTGFQGRLKSTFFNDLGGEWFTDEGISPGDKDSKMVMRRHWIIEWGELAAAQRARDLETLKQFITQRVDRFRPPYGRDLVEAPRHCVIVGTTNRDEFLTDETGNRRWWPVPVKRIDMAWIRENREQLFAEAVALFKASSKCGDCSEGHRCTKHSWWLDDAESAQLEEMNKNFEASDAWQDLVADFLSSSEGNLYPITVGMLLSKAISKDPGQWTHSDEIRVGRILRKLGYEKGKRVRNGTDRTRTYSKVTVEELDLG